MVNYVNYGDTSRIGNIGTLPVLKFNNWCGSM
jgi:hypothetical protein